MTSEAVWTGTGIAVVAGYEPVYFTCVPEAMFWTGTMFVDDPADPRTVKLYTAV